MYSSELPTIQSIFTLYLISDCFLILCKLNISVNKDTGNRFGGSACYNFNPNIALHI